MKILQVTPYFPPHVGGVEYHVKGLSEGLADRGYQVAVASSCGSCHMDFTRIPCLNLLYFPIPISFPRREADIYHSHVPSPTFAYSLRRADPHVITYHNDVVVPGSINGHSVPAPVGDSIEWVNRKIMEPVLEGARIIIATTRSYAESSPALRDHLHKVRIVPNAVDASIYHPGPRRDPYVVYVGRVVQYKGLRVLLEAMKKVQESEALKLVVVGDGYDRRRFEEEAEKMEVRALFTGRVDRQRLIDIISRAEMLVLPTAIRLEAFGIVLLEAMACKTPVLAYDTPGVSEVAREGGMVFSSTEELCSRIIELHQDEALRRVLGERGRRAVEEKYSWATVLDKIEAIYSEVS